MDGLFWRKLPFLKKGVEEGWGVKTEMGWKTTMGNRLNKLYMEVEANQTTGKTSIDGWTVLKKTAIFEEGGGRGMGGQNWNRMKNAHGESFK